MYDAINNQLLTYTSNILETMIVQICACITVLLSDRRIGSHSNAVLYHGAHFNKVASCVNIKSNTQPYSHPLNSYMRVPVQEHSEKKH